MCSATRAVHLEMACSLSTTDFLNAFSRMVDARGRPEEVTSGNGTNFVRADREFRELVLAMDEEQIADNAASDGIRWNWNPPLGSHFGGVFESLVKVAKKTLNSCSIIELQKGIFCLKIHSRYIGFVAIVCTVST